MTVNNKYFNVKTAGITPSGIAYERPKITGQYIVHRTGDDGWHLANGTYDYPTPANPLYVQTLDTTASSNAWRILKHPNIFGNYNRITNLDGTTMSGSVDGAVIDHLTGLMWKYDPYTGIWDDAIDYAHTLTYNGHSDWRMPNINEALSICGQRSGTEVIWLSLNGSYAEIFYSSSTRWDSTTYMIGAIYTAYAFSNPKTTARKAYLCRTFA